MSDRDPIAELADKAASEVEESFRQVSPTMNEVWSPDDTDSIAVVIERHLRAFLAEREGGAPHVVTKRRRGGGREEVAHYMVGPRRETAEEAAEDLDRYVGAFGRERALQGEVAALRRALETVDQILDHLRRLSTPQAVWGYLTLTPDDDVARVHKGVRAALATGAGEREAEVLRAADEFEQAVEDEAELSLDAHRLVTSYTPDEDMPRPTGEWRRAVDRLEDRQIRLCDAVRALRAARGGEGEG